MIDTLYNHGDTKTVECNTCICKDGNMNCTKIECPTVPLTCPIEHQINDTETCCQICKGEDYKHKTVNIEKNAVKPRIVVGKPISSFLHTKYEPSDNLEPTKNIGR